MLAAASDAEALGTAGVREHDGVFLGKPVAPHALWARVQALLAHA